MEHLAWKVSVVAFGVHQRESEDIYALVERIAPSSTMKSSQETFLGQFELGLSVPCSQVFSPIGILSSFGEKQRAIALIYVVFGGFWGYHDQ